MASEAQEQPANLQVGLADVGAVWAPTRSQSEVDEAERAAQDGVVAATEHARALKETLLHELLDCSDTLNAAAAAIVDDTFTKCFKSNAPDPWNWNLYLFPLWCCGVVVRYGILFPIRLLSLTLGFVAFFIAFLPVHYLAPPALRSTCERALIEWLAAAFVFSWTGVVRYHGARPSMRPHQVFVANHTSMIDFIVLEQSTPFAVIMQKHGGWVGWLQTTVLASLGCIHFNRAEASDRASVSARIKAHVQASGTNPLLIFPEGTCVNNEYCCMFKRGAFDLGVTVCPIAIKYNKIFVDAFWNSRREGFTAHLTRIMTSWALVADVWYMEPQTRQESESVDAFAERVRELIAERAGLKCVPWDGLLKYYRPSASMCAKQRQAFADRLLRHLDGSATPRRGAQLSAQAGATGGEGLRRRAVPPLTLAPLPEVEKPDGAAAA